MSLDPEIQQIVGPTQILRCTVGIPDMPSVAYSQQYGQGDLVVCTGTGTNGAVGLLQCLTGGSSPTWGAYPSPAGNAGQLATFNLTAANIIAMNATPVTVLAAPGAGKAIVVEKIIFEMTTTATQFTGGGAVTFEYSGGTTNAVTGTIPASVVTAAAGTSATLLGPAAATNGTTLVANTAIQITNATAAFAAGTGTAKIQIYYTTVTL